MNHSKFLTIAGRWRQHVAVSGIDKKLPLREQSLAMMMFYAGFAAALEAQLEIADCDEAEAIRLLSAMHTESQQVCALAERALSGGAPAS